MATRKKQTEEKVEEQVTTVEKQEEPKVEVPEKKEEEKVEEQVTTVEINGVTYKLPSRVMPRKGMSVRCADGVFVPSNGTVVYTKDELVKLLPFQQYIVIGK